MLIKKLFKNSFSLYNFFFLSHILVLQQQHSHLYGKIKYANDID